MIPAAAGGWDQLAPPQTSSSGALPGTFGMLLRLRMSGMSALSNSSKYALYNLAGRSAHSRVVNLLPPDQTTVKSLPECLVDEGSLNGAGLDQVENRPE